MFIVIYAILLWIQNLNHRNMEINILQKQFKEQQMQLDVLKQTAYFPVYRNSLRGADGMQQYDAEELVLRIGDNINMQAIAQLQNLKRLRLSPTMVAGAYKTDIDFGDISFPKLTELEIVPTEVPMDVNFTGNFESVEHLSIAIPEWYATRPVSYLEKIQKMQKLKLVSFYVFYWFGPADETCNWAGGTQLQDCLTRVKYYHEIIKYCNENNISITETECSGNYKGKPLSSVLNKMCQAN